MHAHNRLQHRMPMSSLLLLQEDYMPEGEVVLTVENKSPVHDTFQFQRISGGLTRWAVHSGWP